MEEQRDGLAVMTVLPAPAPEKDQRKRQALDGTRLNAFGIPPENLTIVGLDTKDGPDHLLYDKRVLLPLDEGLVLNIMKFGVLVAVLVRKNGPLTEVVDGRQRVRATREANRRLVEAGMEPHAVPCFVKRSEDIMGVMLSTFLRTNDAPMAQAQKIQRYLDTGKSEAEAAVVYGTDCKSVKKWLQLLDLAPKVKAAVSHREISATAALELRDLTHVEQEVKLADLIANGGNKAGVELQRQRKVRAAGKNAVVRRRNVSRSILVKLSTNEEFVEKAAPETQAFLLWILGEGTGGGALWRTLKKLGGTTTDAADTDDDAE